MDRRVFVIFFISVLTCVLSKNAASNGLDGKQTHGPNAVISMLHDCMFKHGLGERKCILHADNCAGWNEKIDWLTFDEAQETSEKTNKPIMLLIHKSWCGACKSLKPKFSESKDIEELSKNFLMVNLLDDDEPKGDKYSPDGGYIPRILFLRGDEVLTDLIHEGGNAKYKYFYHNAEGIIKTMMRAVETLNLASEDGSREDL